jgi:hypothetical protein
VYAIVLTYDRNAVLTEHMIRCYEDLWPNHPFVFRIPFQHENRCYPLKNREYLRTSSDIKPTILTLIKDLDDEEWIYWNIDDRYPTKIKQHGLTNIIHNLSKVDLPDLCGIMFCRSRIMMKRERLMTSLVSFSDFLLFERIDYFKIWMPQFLKVKVIRYMFNKFPDVIEKAIDMDALKNALTKPPHHRLFVTNEDYADFEESTIGGVLTELCYSDLLAKGFNIPDWFTGNLIKNPVRRF